MIFRQARLTDVPEIAAILAGAVEAMMLDGNLQWTASYPVADDVIADVLNGVAYVLEDDQIVAYGALILAGEPAYDALAGEWISDGPYAVVHRLAVDSALNARGLGGRFLKLCENIAVERGCTSFRIDTKDTNRRMMRLLEKCGFEYCGEVRYGERIRRAYEKLI